MMDRRRLVLGALATPALASWPHRRALGDLKVTPSAIYGVRLIVTARKGQL